MFKICVTSNFQRTYWVRILEAICSQHVLALNMVAIFNDGVLILLRLKRRLWSACGYIQEGSIRLEEKAWESLSCIFCGG